MTPVVCSTCSDAHRMTLDERTVMCTRCPTPCQRCRTGGIGPYCTNTPCACVCHGGRFVDVPVAVTPKLVRVALSKTTRTLRVELSVNGAPVFLSEKEARALADELTERADEINTRRMRSRCAKNGHRSWCMCPPVRRRG